jgi:PadR family transcriptional regulator PadR
MIPRELIAASTKPIVLAILSEGESYGYALIQRVKELSKDEIHWSEGMLYPFLHWMEQEGLIESEWKAAESGRSRKYYRLSGQGKKALESEKAQWFIVHNTLLNLWNPVPSSA